MSRRKGPKALAGLGHRWGLWDFGAGFTILRWAAYLGAGAAAMSACVWVYALLLRSGSGLLLAGLAVAIGVASAAVPWSYLKQARELPQIHDISTDTELPPRFVALLSARDGAGARSDYGGPSVAGHQLKGYPKTGSVAYRPPPDRGRPRWASLPRGRWVGECTRGSSGCSSVRPGPLYVAGSRPIPATPAKWGPRRRSATEKSGAGSVG